MSDVGAGAGTEDTSVEFFLEQLGERGRSERTRAAYERVLGQFETFLADPNSGPDGESVSPAEATYRHCRGYVDHLRGDHAPATVATYATYVRRFYASMCERGAFDSNPMALVTDELDEGTDAGADPPEMDLDAVRSLVAKVVHPLHRAVLVTLLKTGVQVGELCNLDLRDLQLTGSSARQAFDYAAREELSGHGDALYVPAAPSRGEAYNGEERTASNKRARPAVIPVDAELTRDLERWLAARPDTPSLAGPLFVSTADKWGRRLTPKSVRTFIAQYVETDGWRRSDAGDVGSVTPHSFRRFFSSHLQDRTDDPGLVAYLRGDAVEEAVAVDARNWAERVRAPYQRHVYRLVD